MTESQFKRWMIAKTRQYIGLITNINPNFVRISFYKNFNRFDLDLRNVHGCCYPDRNIIYYRLDYIRNWDVDVAAIEKLVIHEVCHLLHFEHDAKFFTEYRKWSGDDVIDRWVNQRADYVQNGIRYVSAVQNLPRLGCQKSL